MRNVRSNFQHILATATEYHAVGPFALNERLDMLYIQLSMTEAAVITIAPVLHPTPDATAATIAAGAPLIETSEQQLAGANAFALHASAAATNIIALPLRTNALASQMWVHLAIFNNHGTESCAFLMTVTAGQPSITLTPGTVPTVPIGPQPPPPAPPLAAETPPYAIAPTPI